MRISKTTSIGAAAAGVVLSLLGTTAAHAAAETLVVPDDFIAALSGTKGTGSYTVEGSGLRITTSDNTSASKVAEYWAPPSSELPSSGSLSYTAISGTIPPGAQIVFDADSITGNGNDYNVLVGEAAYNGDWWLTSGSSDTAKNVDPSGADNGGSGSDWFGTLSEWSAALSGERVYAYGFSLGSGVLGDGVINSATFGDTTYTFGEASAEVVLTSKEQCKDGGWETSTNPTFRNQGECVSSFAKK